MATLAQRLRSETRHAHTAAERSPFMGDLLRGRMDRAGYCALLRNLHPIYAALEPALLLHAQHPVLSPVVITALWRSQALADDLGVLHGPSWEGDLAVQPASVDYVMRLQHLSDGQPDLLLAHAYVRYLGDLSGGQLLRRIVRDSMGLPEHAGTAFYEFGSAEETRSLTLAFREGLAGVVVDQAKEDALVEEALLAFEMHQRLFEGLASRRAT